MKATLPAQARKIVKRAIPLVPRGHFVLVLVSDGPWFATATNADGMTTEEIAAFLRATLAQLEAPAGGE